MNNFHSEHGVNAEEKGVNESSSMKRKTSRIQFLNLPGSISRADIDNLCSAFGKVVKIEQSVDDSTLAVLFSSPDEADQALAGLNGQQFRDSTLSVELGSKPRERRRPRSAGPATRGMPNAWMPNRFPMPRERNMTDPDLPLRMLIPTDMVGAVIGRGGATIRTITNQTRARVDVLRKDSPAPLVAKEKLVTIYGSSSETCSAACKEILKVLSEDAKTSGRQEPPLKLLVANQFCGRIIGRGGKSLESIMSETNTSISISNQLYNSSGQSMYEYSMYDYGSSGGTERVVTIAGPDADALSAAEALVSAKVKAAHNTDMSKAQSMYYGNYGRRDYAPRPGGYYQQQMYPSYLPPAGPPHAVETTHVIVPHTAVGAIIGTKGANIRDIMARSGSQIKVENKDSNVGSPDRRVTVTGNAAAQWHAQLMLYECLRPEYRPGSGGYDEPSMHTQIMVAKSLMGRVIGKQHCNLRDIKTACAVSIKIPEEEEQEDEVPISIHGSFEANQFAQHRIRSLLATTRLRPGSPKEFNNGMRSRRGGSLGGAGRIPQQPLMSAVEA